MTEHTQNGLQTDVKDEFDKLKRRIRYCKIVNKLPVELNALRNFFIENGIAENSHISMFVNKWLSSPLVIEGIEVVGLLKSEEINELIYDLENIRL